MLELIKKQPQYELIQAGLSPIPVKTHLDGVMALLKTKAAAELRRVADGRVVLAKAAGQIQNLSQLRG